MKASTVFCRTPLAASALCLSLTLFASTDIIANTPPPAQACEKGQVFYDSVPKQHNSYFRNMLDWLENTTLDKQQQADIDNFWQELVTREEKLRNFIDNADSVDSPELDEHAQSLFVLNHILPDISAGLKHKLNMPCTSILKSEYQKVMGTHHETLEQKLKDFSFHDLPISGFLDQEGNLYNPAKYSQLDPGWSTALAYYIGYKTGFIQKAPMNQPAYLDLSDRTDISILVVGDWGTGYWTDGTDPSPAQMVMNAMQQHQATIAIHLGDEYYAGTRYTMDGHPGEEAFNFTSLWDPGTEYSFALGSNHGMYDGENGLRYLTLESPKFAAQNKSTTFAIELSDWIIVGLDTARNDPSTLFQDGALDPVQGKFLKKMGEKGKKLLLLTHHTAISLDGKKQNDPLWSQVNKYLGRQPDYWIWGHIHQGIVYSPSSAAGKMVGRCWGHGAIPVGTAKELLQKDGSCIPEISYYSHTPYPNPDREQKLRIRNGYGLLNFSGDQVNEQLYDQYGNLQWEDALNFSDE